MKITFRLLITLLCCCLQNTNAIADTIVWSEDWTGVADGAASDAATSTGAGFLDYTGTVNIAGEAAVITPDGGSDRIEFETSPEGNCVAGFFEFDISVVEGNGGSVNMFFQMVDGLSRSTNGAPLPNFADTVSSSAGGNNFNLSTTPTTVRWYFNVSGADITYVAPDGSTTTLINNTYDAWSGTTAQGLSQTGSGQGGGLPTNIDTAVIQLFNSAAGSTWTVDNASLSHITAVPEPASAGLFGLVVCGLVCRRRKFTRLNVTY
jgi:hypothetical protein